MVAAQCLGTCKPVVDARRILPVHLFPLQEFDKIQDSFYLEACEKHASNKTNVDGLLAFAGRLDQLLNSLVVLI